MAWIRLRYGGGRRLLDLLAAVAYVMFFAEAASAVMRTIADDTIFMTQVHEVLQRSLFLIGGAYLGPYGLGVLLGWTFSRNE